MIRRSLPALRTMLILSESDVKKCLDLRKCLEANRVALRGVYNEQAVVPSRIGLPYPNDDWTLFKPAAFSTDTLGIKVVSVRSGNPARGLPMVPATVLHMHPTTGIVEAVVSATFLTAARTAAGSALTVQLCTKKVDHLVLFGAGLQARLHVESIVAALDGALFGRITIINRTHESANDLMALISPYVIGKNVEIVLLSDSERVDEVVGQADVICTCTGSATPLWSGSVTLKDDCIITGVGSYTPDQCEVPLEAVQSCDVVYIDTPEAKSVGDLKQLSGSVTSATASTFATPNLVLLGEVLVEESDRNTEKPRGRVFFKSVGTAVQDVLTAAEVVRQAKSRGLGTTLDMD